MTRTEVTFMLKIPMSPLPSLTRWLVRPRLP